MTEQENARIESAIIRLTEIATNIDKMLGIHEQRLNQQEKNIGAIETIFEKRREEAERILNEVYTTIKTEDQSILSAVSSFRDNTATRFDKVETKINSIEKKMWGWSVGFSLIVLIMTYGKNILLNLLTIH